MPKQNYCKCSGTRISDANERSQDEYLKVQTPPDSKYSNSRSIQFRSSKFELDIIAWTWSEKLFMLFELDKAEPNLSRIRTAWFICIPDRNRHLNQLASTSLHGEEVQIPDRDGWKQLTALLISL